MSESLKVALVGCGRIAKKHVEALKRAEGLRLVAVCDTIPNRAIPFSQEYLVPWFRDMHLLVETQKPDLISILTPTHKHLEHVLVLAPYGIPLLVEKPLALRLEDVDRMAEACQKHGALLGEVRQNRYNVAILSLQRTLEDGTLGLLTMVSVRMWWHRKPEYYDGKWGRWDQAGGVLANQASHHIDLLWWLLGDVSRVSALAAYSPYAVVETDVVAILEFVGNGCIGTLEATTVAPPDYADSIVIIGSKDMSADIRGFAGHNPRVDEPFGGYIGLYEDIAQRLANGESMPIPPEEARATLEIIHAIYESVETGQVVELEGYYPHSRLGKKI